MRVKQPRDDTSRGIARAASSKKVTNEDFANRQRLLFGCIGAHTATHTQLRLPVQIGWACSAAHLATQTARA